MPSPEDTTWRQYPGPKDFSRGSRVQAWKRKRQQSISEEIKMWTEYILLGERIRHSPSQLSIIRGRNLESWSLNTKVSAVQYTGI